MELPGSLGNLQGLAPAADYGNHSFSIPPIYLTRAAATSNEKVHPKK